MTERKQASIAVAYLFWLCLAVIGAHRFYLGRAGSAVLQMLTFLMGFGLFLYAEQNGGVLLLGRIGIGLVAVWFLWLLLDGFLIPGMVRKRNAALRPDAPAAPAARPSSSFRETSAPGQAPEGLRQDPLAGAAVIENAYERERKSVGVAYLIWFLFGAVGGHRLYLRTASGLVIALILIGALIGVSAIFREATGETRDQLAFLVLAVFGVYVLWLLLEAVTLVGRVRRYNEARREKIIEIARAQVTR